jgi:hypothetical protein
MGRRKKLLEKRNSHKVDRIQCPICIYQFDGSSRYTYHRWTENNKTVKDDII